jgi:hypothetical protein
MITNAETAPGSVENRLRKQFAGVDDRVTGRGLKNMTELWRPTRGFTNSPAQQ